MEKLPNKVLMNTDSLHKKLKRLVLDKLPNTRLIYLFGSFANGSAGHHSDIDIAIMTEHKLEPIARWKVQSALANELNVDVDLVDLLSASTVMQHQVLTQGVCLFDKAHYHDKYIMQVMSMYQHLNAERVDILRRVQGS